MVDIAQIGFRADTSDLVDAKQKLEALGPAASKATKASSQIINGMTRLSSSIELLNTNIIQLITNNGKQVQSASKVVTSTNNQATAAKAAANAMNLQAAAATKAAAANNKLSSSGSGGSGGSGKNNVIPIRSGVQSFNTGNIAAQFQDIGVTAAMGMNPLQIALQQGTQLAAVFNTMEKPLQGIAQGFKMIFNATSLLTIGLVGLVAAGLEMINWTSVGKTVLNGLADAIEVCTPYVLGLAAAMTLLYSRTIIAGLASVIWSITTMGVAAIATGIQMVSAWVMSLGPIGLILFAISSIIAAFVLLSSNSKKTINQIIGMFVGAYNIITSKKMWGSLPDVFGDLMIQASNNVIKYLEDMINKGIQGINKLSNYAGQGDLFNKVDLGQFDNKFAGSAAKAGQALTDEMNQAMNKDYVGGIEKRIKNAANKVRGFADGLGDGKTKKDPWVELNKGAARTIATLTAERDAVGLSAEATSYLKRETELLNQAQQKGIALTPQQTLVLKGLASQMSVLEEQTRQAKEALDFAKDATKGFFQDMRQGLAEGQSMWQTFGNAVNKVLDKIIDKLMDEMVNALYTTGGTGGGGVGFLASVGKLFFNKNGNAFDNNGIQTFANGGTFTNSVVNKATPFAFAKGGALGVMGEAGPEAIMPLKRGSDGSLGVQMYNQSGSSNDNNNVEVNVNIINNSKAQVNTQTSRNGDSINIDVMLDEAVAQNISRPGTKTNQALKAQQQRQLINR